jgi:hypothetical protein
MASFNDGNQNPDDAINADGLLECEFRSSDWKSHVSQAR